MVFRRRRNNNHPPEGVVEFKRRNNNNNSKGNGNGRLTDLQARFVDEYCRDFNGPKAALRAGYDRYNIFSAAKRNFESPKVMEAISERKAAISEALRADSERVLNELSRMSFYSAKDFVNEDTGEVLSIHEMDDDAARAVESVESFPVYEGRGNDRQLIGYRTRVRCFNKQAALEALARNLGLFEKDNRLSLELSLKQLFQALPPELADQVKKKLTMQLELSKGG